MKNYKNRDRRLAEQGWQLTEIEENQYGDPITLIYTNECYDGVIIEEDYLTGEILRRTSAEFWLSPFEKQILWEAQAEAFCNECELQPQCDSFWNRNWNCQKLLAALEQPA